MKKNQLLLITLFLLLLAMPILLRARSICHSNSLIVTNGFIPKNWLTLDDTAYSISYPPEWNLDKSGKMGTVFFLLAPRINENNNFNANINLYSGNIEAEDKSLKELVAESEKQVMKFITDAEILQSEAVIVQGKEFHSLQYLGRQGQSKLHFMQYFTLHKGQTYVLTFSVLQEDFEYFEEIALQIFETFKLK